MNNPDFEDFILEGGWDLLFSDDEEGSFECPFCGQVIQGSQKVQWIDKNEKRFKCPACSEILEIG